MVARFSPFGDDVILMQDRCTVCTKCTIGSKIPMVLLCDEPQVEAHFDLFRDIANLDAR